MTKRATLKNGIRVLGASMKSTQAFTVLVLVRAGSKYETKYTNGTAHYLEHMIFKGSKDYPSVRAITETLDGLGAEYNAFTAKELTGYWVKVAGSNASRALKIVASMLEKPLFPAQEFEIKIHSLCAAPNPPCSFPRFQEWQNQSPLHA